MMASADTTANVPGNGDQWVLVNKDGKSRKLPRSMVFVGREECDVILKSPTVDKRHAVIYFNTSDDQFHIKDLSSAYGTFINDSKLPELSYVTIKHMDRIRFGFASESFLVCKIPSPGTSSVKETGSELSNHLSESINNETKPNNPSGHNVSSATSTNPSSSILAADVLQENRSKTKAKNCVDDRKNSLEKSASIIAKAENDLETSNKFSAEENRLSRAASTPPVSAMAFTVTFDNDSNKQLNIRDSIRKFAPPKPDSIEKQRPPKRNQSLESTSSTPTRKPSIPKGSDSKSVDGHLSDSASYLIQRMLNSDQVPLRCSGDSGKRSSTDKAIPHASLRKNEETKKDLKTPVNGDSGVVDDRSECGTYTLEGDAQDPAVDEARKRIDDVFGVSLIEKLDMDSISHSFHESRASGNVEESNKHDCASLLSLKTKRKLPTVPQQSCSDNEALKPLLLKSETNTMSRSLTANKNSFTILSLNRNGDSKSFVSDSRGAQNGRESRSKDTTLQDEVSSLKSDQISSTSNEGSEKSKSIKDEASAPSSPQMRFNRAFALRRARLGIETPEVNMKKPSEVHKGVQNKASAGVSNRNPAFNRNDGGRFSLRATKHASDNKKPPIGNISKQSSSREDVRKHNHQRKFSDPNCVKNIIKQSRSSYSDAENSDSRSSTPHYLSTSVQRSSSFGNTDNLPHNASKSDSDYLRTMSPFQVSKRMFSTKPHQMAKLDNSVRSKPFSLGSPCLDERKNTRFEPITQENKPKKELSALDNLVISAINQLSYKLRNSLGNILNQGRLRYPGGSEARIMIEELLPQFSAADARPSDCTENTTSRDLSNILKNLKKIEQSIEIISFMLEPATYSSYNPNPKSSNASESAKSFFSVDL